MIKKFKKFIGRRRQGFREKNLSKDEPNREKEKEKEKEPPLCYECKKSDHFKETIQHLKKTFKRSKKKAMIVT